MEIRTAREMKVWLAALEEFQGDNWCPSHDQWSVIRDKIYGLNEDEYEFVEEVVHQPAHHAQQTSSFDTVSPPQPTAPVSVATPQLPSAFNGEIKQGGAAMDNSEGGYTSDFS